MDDNKRHGRRRIYRLFLALAAVIVAIAVLELFASSSPGNGRFSIFKKLFETASGGNLGGDKLRLAGWEASFIERGLTVPPEGPREGIEGEGVTALRCATSECNPYKDIPGIIEIDSNGFQTAGDIPNPYPHILIIGGSVAWGAGASDIDNTYFSRLYGILKNEYPDVRISVLAYYGSASNTDLSSFIRKGLDAEPDAVVFLNGLNDLTVKGETRHSDAADYIINMETAALIGKRHNIPVIIVRQPFPGGKKHKTALERRILELSRKDYETVITPLYNHMGKALQKLAGSGEIYYIDAASCFDEETATTFNDQWHFSDPGHKLLAERMYQGLVPILNEVLRKNINDNDRKRLIDKE